jgi:kynurenine formamidase
LHSKLYQLHNFCQNVVPVNYSPALLCNVPSAVCDHGDYLDLSYTFSDQTIFFPGQQPFHLNKLGRRNTSDFYYASYSFCAGEHGGTHIDAPSHFAKTGWSVEQIPNERLVDVPGAVIDVTHQVDESSDPASYAVSVEDLRNHEEQYGRIPQNGLVIIMTGWGGKYWGDKAKYLGEKILKNGTTALAFPGLSVSAAQWLYNERGIVGIGVDTASVDPGHSKHFEAHQFLAARQVYNLENVAHLHLVRDRALKRTERDSYKSSTRDKCSTFNFFVLPIKIEGGTGAPVRILAKCMRKWADDTTTTGSGAGRLRSLY